ncbi:zinc finger protein 142 isoform X2 [Echeneis naucrates]|uniref:C2H2-type domain-containing protein n=2 Tax=Echeneis naucrates TaxID=173247 RepID=A0A665VSP2_ECHNA|nr:zinc finger protein 142 isoform X2 [Echeneis naucrates]
METAELHPCERCGQSFADRDVFATHACPKRMSSPSSDICSQRDEVFPEPGNETASTAVCTTESQRLPVPTRTKRKVKSNLTYSSSSLGDGHKEQPEKEGHSLEKRKVVDNAKSKEYLAEGAEHIYRTHTCPMCRRCFKMRSHLQEHLHLHFPDPSLQCPTCKRYFTSKSKLRVHRLREAGEKLHRCHLCDYSAVEKNAVRRHLVSVHADVAEDGGNSRSYPCPSCSQSFHQCRSLKAHMKIHNIPPDSKPLACFHKSCSFQSPWRKELLRHIVEVHGVKAVECRHHACGAIFQAETDMEMHYKTHLAYHCSQCDFSCSNKTVFFKHQRHGHPGDDRLCCDFCPFITFNPVEFEQHVELLHANEKIHRCSQCSYVTSHKRGLRRHMLMHSGEKPHKCSLCDFRCRDESYLSKHMLTHSDNKNFMCAECGYVTKWKHYLNVHMRKHAGDLRYRCDQCPYRCHRMDQLNSHKLRHQAKSLMCEICAYACKRKYELRNHMLAKHSAEEKQPTVYKCKYCTYTTSYRQALQNHENCKHTKQKEFSCALCFYSSFSSISLFLHKRKAHGYIPGDKAWLENYAVKEKERNSTEMLQDFYKCSTGPKLSAQSTEKCDRLGANKDTLPGSKIAGAVNAFGIASQEAVHEGISENAPSLNGPEEYCTLILTTLSTIDYQPPSVKDVEEKCPSQTTATNNSDRAKEKVDSSTPASSSEEDTVAVAHEDCELSDFDESSKNPTNSTSQPVEDGKYQTPEVDRDSEAEAINSAVLQSQPLDFDDHLKAMKKHDKDQADAMLLEGRVQMLVVPTKDVYRCDKCPYVTYEETALNHHHQTLCHGKIKVHKCQACGAQFKQRRGLNSHVAKKCPALPRKTRTFVAVSSTCLTAKQSGQNLSSPITTSTDSSNQEFHQQEEEACMSHLTVSEGSENNVPTSTQSGHQQSKAQINKPLKAKLARKQVSRGLLAPILSLYTKKDGKFKCKLCNFSAVKLATVERHLSICRKKCGRRVKQILSEVDTEAVKGKDSVDDSGKNKKKPKILSCPGFPDDAQSSVDTCNIPLTCHISHVPKKTTFSVAKSLHCQQCPFTCKQQRCMAQHVALKHKGERPHRCRYCPFATTRRYRLEEHESLHTGIGRHKCDTCDKTFGAVTKLRQHKMRIHDKQPRHFCTLCDFCSYTLDDVKRHNLRCHTGELEHPCTHCDARFSSEIALRNHCKRVHQFQVHFSCKQCDFTCNSEDTLKAHQQSKHHQVKCSTCQESFETKESLESHQRSHLAHPCQLCPFAAKTRQLLGQHLLSEHEQGPLEEKPLRCSVCQFACRHQLVLEQHLRSHGGKRLYKCTDCEYSTRNKQKMTWHIRIHTGEKPYSCEQCTYTCTDPSRLKLHMRVHQEEKKYLCPECGYKCKWATQLKYHMTKHTGERPYACDECEYRTNRADALRAHRDTQHCDMRPFICEKCGKAFKTSFLLKTHQRQHSDDRPYTCGLCRKAFRWPAGLRHHYLSHTKQQPFCCRHCPYRAKQKFQVVKHLQRHHPEKSVEQGVVRDSEVLGLTLREALQGTLEEEGGGVAMVAEEAEQIEEDSETNH